MLRIATGLLLTTLLCLSGAALCGEKKKPDDPKPRTEAILELFVKEFVAITPGKGMFPAGFAMGSEKIGDDNERPVVPVTFKHSFAMAKYEVTQELYHVVMGKNPARWQGPRNSVEMTSWHESAEFCTRVTKLLRERRLISAWEVIRLPSEAEWEYCCRAGTTTAYSFGDEVAKLTEFGWYKDNSKGYDPPVGAKKGNPWGLFDMHGYVSEWVLDAWRDDYKKLPTDGSAFIDADSKDRVARSGGYPDAADLCRSAARQRVAAAVMNDKLGFRCVKDAERK